MMVEEGTIAWKSEHWDDVEEEGSINVIMKVLLRSRYVWESISKKWL